MALVLSLRRLAAASRLPFILVSSAPLRDTSTLLESRHTAMSSPSLIERQLRTSVEGHRPHGRHDKSRPSQAKQKEMKKRGFNAIIRWCAYHQNAVRTASTDSDEGTAAAAGVEVVEARRMDAAVLQWVNESLETFSCGQSLVVLSFLCDVLYRRAKVVGDASSLSSPSGLMEEVRDDAAPFSADRARSSDERYSDALAHTIHRLRTRVCESDQLEQQPFFVLLSAVYGLCRITDGNPLQLLDLDLHGLRPQDGMWVALLHQLRTFHSALYNKNTSIEDSANADAVFTVLWLFTPRRKQSLFSPGDHKMYTDLTRRLWASLEPAVRDARAARAQQTQQQQQQQQAVADKPGGAGSSNAEEWLSADSEDRSGGTPSVKAARARGTVGDTAISGRMSMKDCVKILQNMAATTVECRVGLVEYFLFVRHDPATLTATELAEVPRLFAAASAMRELQSTALADDVISRAQVRDLRLLVEFSVFVSNFPTAFALIEDAAQKLVPANSTADFFFSPAKPPLSAKLAWSILWLKAPQMSSQVRALLLWCCLAESPVVLGAVTAALAETRRGADQIGSGDRPAAAVADAPTVPVSPPLLCALRALFLIQLQRVRLPLPDNLTPERRQHWREILSIAKAVVQSIDWQRCDANQLYSEAKRVHNLTTRSPADAAHILLTVYVDSHYRFRFLGEENELEDRVLLNTLVLPLLRGGLGDSQRALIYSLLPHLKSVEYQRQLLVRLGRLAVPGTYKHLFEFATVYAPLASRLCIYPEALATALFKYHTLTPRKLPSVLAGERANDAKVHTVVLLAVVRYLIAAGALAPGKHSDMAARQETLGRWFQSYFYAMTLEVRRADKAREAGGDGDEGPAAAVGAAEDGAGDGATDDTETAVGATAEAAVQTTEEGSSDAPESGDEGGAADREDDADLAAAAEEEDEAAKEEEDGGNIAKNHAICEGTVTDDELDAVLTLMLQLGVKASSQALSVVAQRMRARMYGRADEQLPLSDAMSDEFAPRAEAATTSWADGAEAVLEDGRDAAAQEALYLPFHRLPPPAHFIFAARADSALPLPLSPGYLTALLTTCDITIYHHVVSAFFSALKRRRTVVVLSHDLEISATVVRVLQERLSLYQATREENATGETKVADELLSTVALKTLVSILNHFSKLPHYTPGLRAMLEDVEKGSLSPAEEGQAVEQPGPAASEELLQQIRQARAEAAPGVLRIAAFIVAAQMKDFALSQLQRLSLFFPEAAHFVFVQVRPQLPSFAQRELLQLASQYPASAPEVLEELCKLDLHVSVDLGEFVPLAKRLPMSVVAAVVTAHVPHLTVAWVTRILSALTVRHEALPQRLLGLLLSRVEAVADSATESDKSLLLLILQGYLIFGPSQRPVGGSAVGIHGGEADRRADGWWMEDLCLTRVGAVPLDAAAMQERVGMVQQCCDQLLSLERIATLEELRYFLVSYPPSLHQLRERGVVDKVERELLPSLLDTTPVNMAELKALVSLLHEHRVLLPSTVQRIESAVFTATQLEALHQSAVTSTTLDCTTTLRACLHVATVCAMATQAPGSSATAQRPLLEKVDMLLNTFDSTQDWLAAFAGILSAQGRSSGSGSSPAASALSAPQRAVARHLCSALLEETDTLTASEFAQLVQSLSRLKAWDLVMAPQLHGEPHGQAGGGDTSVAPQQHSVDFLQVFSAMFERADAHSRCVLLRAITSDRGVFCCFEATVFGTLLHDVAVLSAEDLELVLTAALQVSDVAVAEPVLDRVGTRLLPMVDQCRRSVLVRLLQGYNAFQLEDRAVVLAALAALERQSPVELKLDAAQVIVVLQSIAGLPLPDVPERLVELCFARLEKLLLTLTPTQLYSTGRLILDLGVEYGSSLNVLMTAIIESRDGPRGHAEYHTMAEELCDVYDVELASSTRIPRLRKRKHDERVRAYYAAQAQASPDA